jgi:hypothetical protein
MQPANNSLLVDCNSQMPRNALKEFLGCSPALFVGVADRNDAVGQAI